MIASTTSTLPRPSSNSTVPNHHLSHPNTMQNLPSPTSQTSNPRDDTTRGIGSQCYRKIPVRVCFFSVTCDGATVPSLQQIAERSRGGHASGASNERHRRSGASIAAAFFFPPPHCIRAIVAHWNRREKAKRCKWECEWEENESILVFVKVVSDT